MPWVNNSQPSVVERVVGGLCYLTLGLAGLLFIIISGQRGQSQFFRFHFLQSIIVGIIALLLSWASNVFISLILGLLSMLSGLMGSAAPLVAYWVTQGLTIVLNAFNLLLVYGAIWSFLGKFAEIPFISDLVRRQM